MVRFTTILTRSDDNIRLHKRGVSAPDSCGPWPTSSPLYGGQTRDRNSLPTSALRDVFVTLLSQRSCIGIFPVNEV